MTGAIGLMGKRVLRAISCITKVRHWLGWYIGGSQGINLNVAQPAASVENEKRNKRMIGLSLRLFAHIYTVPYPFTETPFVSLHFRALPFFDNRQRRS